MSDPTPTEPTREDFDKVLRNHHPPGFRILKAYARRIEGERDVYKKDYEKVANKRISDAITLNELKAENMHIERERDEGKEEIAYQRRCVLSAISDWEKEVAATTRLRDELRGMLEEVIATFGWHGGEALVNARARLAELRNNKDV